MVNGSLLRCFLNSAVVSVPLTGSQRIDGYRQISTYFVYSGRLAHCDGVHRFKATVVRR